MAAFNGTKASWAQEGQHQKKINGSLLRAPKMPWAQDHHPPQKIDTCSFIVVILTLVPLTLYPSPYTFILTLITLPLPLYLTPYP